MTILGGSGHVGRVYIREFLSNGLQTQVLARTSEKVSQRFPDAVVIQGSMMEESDVFEAISGADAVLLITPIYQVALPECCLDSPCPVPT